MTKLTRKRFTKKNLEKIKHHLPFQDSDGNWQNKAPKKDFVYLFIQSHLIKNLIMRTGLSKKSNKIRN